MCAVIYKSYPNTQKQGEEKFFLPSIRNKKITDFQYFTDCNGIKHDPTKYSSKTVSINEFVIILLKTSNP